MSPKDTTNGIVSVNEHLLKALSNSSWIWDVKFHLEPNKTYIPVDPNPCWQNWEFESTVEFVKATESS